MKARRKKDLLLCFGQSRLLGDETEGEKQKPTSLSSSSGESGDLPPQEEEARKTRVVGRRRKAARRIFSNIIRSTLFVTSRERAGSGKVRQDPNRPMLRKHSDDNASDPESTDEDDPKSDSAFSSSSLSNPSTSSSSSSTFPARERGPRRKKPAPPVDWKTPTPGQWNYGTATGLCLVVLSLSVMLFWGRLCAILLTSTWLCFMPRRESDVAAAAEKEEEEAAPVAVVVRGRRGLEEYDKKRVVLEGILERNRRV